MKKVAILGFGTVGSGVYEMLKLNREKIKGVCGSYIDIGYVVDIRDFSDREDSEIFIKDFNTVLNDPEVGIVAEVIGGVHPAYEFTRAALESGKSVVTSNKELVAKKGSELLKIAAEHDVNYLFEASVGGGIPVIRPLHNCLAANEIKSVCGILNGTTNYILTEMFKEGTDFEAALSEAQRLGYAERDPSADIEGIDSARKIAILMALVTDWMIPDECIAKEGISAIDATDVLYAERLGGVIKLMGYGYEKNGRVYAAVAPSVVDGESPIYSVNDVFNGICAEGNAVGQVMFYGRGAGKLPTASAVVADICDIAKDPGNKNYFWSEAPKEKIISFDEARESYLIRLASSLRDEVLKRLGGGKEISVKSGECGIITPVMTNAEINKALAGVEIIKKIRMHKGEEE